MRAGFGIALLLSTSCGSVEPSGDADADTDVDSDSDADTDTGGPCSIDEDCGEPQPGGWSACDALEACATTGRRSREVQTPRCLDGDCSMVPTTEEEDCARETEGIPCGAEIPGDWSNCAYSSGCDESGTQNRIVQVQECQAGDCVLGERAEEMPCGRETDGEACDDGDPCSYETYCGDGICSGPVCAPCPC